MVGIDLNVRMTDALRALDIKQIDKKKAIEFVSWRLRKLKPGSALELFQHCC